MPCQPSLTLSFVPGVSWNARARLVTGPLQQQLASLVVEGVCAKQAKRETAEGFLSQYERSRVLMTIPFSVVEVLTSVLIRHDPAGARRHAARHPMDAAAAMATNQPD